MLLSRVRLTPAPGSSSSTILGSAIRVRPSSRSFFWPPERLPAYSSARWERVSISSTSRACASIRRSSCATLPGPEPRRPQLLSHLPRRHQHEILHDRHPLHLPGIWKVHTSPRPKVSCMPLPSMRRPWKAILPLVGRMNPETTLNRVVFPARLGPIMPVMWPGSISKLQWSSARTPPNPSPGHALPELALNLPSRCNPSSTWDFPNSNIQGNQWSSIMAS